MYFGSLLILVEKPQLLQSLFLAINMKKSMTITKQNTQPLHLYGENTFHRVLPLIHK